MGPLYMGHSVMQQLLLLPLVHVLLLTMIAATFGAGAIMSNFCSIVQFLFNLWSCSSIYELVESGRKWTFYPWKPMPSINQQS